MSGSKDNDERVRRLVEMVAGGSFRAGQSHQQLAAEWGIDVRTVSELLTQACRFIRLSRGDLDDVITRKLAGLEDLRQRALDRVKVYYDKDGCGHEAPEPDLRAAIEADKLYLQAVGALTGGKPAEKPKTPGDAEEYQKMSPEQRIAELEKAIEEERAALGDRRH